jgi:hypothetical protein
MGLQVRTTVNRPVDIGYSKVTFLLGFEFGR